jgi:hypothetical protein
MKLALHIGFAGARSLWPKELRHLLGELRNRLQVTQSCFPVGISQIAIGADSLFAEACAAETIPLRVFLPQTPYASRLKSSVTARGKPRNAFGRAFK